MTLACAKWRYRRRANRRRAPGRRSDCADRVYGERDRDRGAKVLMHLDGRCPRVRSARIGVDRDTVCLADSRDRECVPPGENLFSRGAGTRQRIGLPGVQACSGRAGHRGEHLRIRRSRSALRSLYAGRTGRTGRASGPLRTRCTGRPRSSRGSRRARVALDPLQPLLAGRSGRTGIALQPLRPRVALESLCTGGAGRPGCASRPRGTLRTARSLSAGRASWAGATLLALRPLESEWPTLTSTVPRRPALQRTASLPPGNEP